MLRPFKRVKVHRVCVLSTLFLCHSTDTNDAHKCRTLDWKCPESLVACQSINQSNFYSATNIPGKARLSCVRVDSCSRTHNCLQQFTEKHCGVSFQNICVCIRSICSRFAVKKCSFHIIWLCAVNNDLRLASAS